MVPEKKITRVRVTARGKRVVVDDWATTLGAAMSLARRLVFEDPTCIVLLGGKGESTWLVYTNQETINMKRHYA